MAATLTIGTATYRDFAGLYATINHIRTNNPDVIERCEFVVVDNDPKGPQAGRLRGYMANVAMGAGVGQAEKKQRLLPQPFNVQYVSSTVQGTSAPRDEIFRRATGDAVLVIDSHIDLFPGVIRRLLDYFDANPDSGDLIQGPLVMDDMGGAPTHFSDVWRGGMWGTWGVAWIDPDGRYVDIRQTVDKLAGVFDLKSGEWLKTLPVAWHGHEIWLPQMGFRLAIDGGQPFEIPSQGLGFYACRRDAWLGYNPDFREFGGEEGYIHAKFRQAGRKTLCDPALKWMHRFADPDGGRAYRRTDESKVRNYIIGHQELGLPLDRVYRHFVEGLNEDPTQPGTGKGVLTPEQWDYLTTHLDEYPINLPACGGCAEKKAKQVESQTLEQLFNTAATVKSDINEHAAKMKELASQCKSVVEFGHRPRVSTVALLAGQPQSFKTFVTKDDPVLTALKPKAGTTKFEVAQGDSLSVDIEDCDLLFIDTRHTADQLWGELTKHASQVRRWIALHDTQIYGEKGEDGGPGLLPAMRRFMKQHPEWSVIYHAENNHGFTVLSRDDRDKPQVPGIARQVWNFAGAMIRDLANGQQRLDDEAAESRLDVCSTCPSRTGERCSVCSCYLHQRPDGSPGKVFYPTEQCPLGKWTEATNAK